jgi:hypothetical protein
MSKITNTSVFIPEGASAATDVAGSGQIWVKSDAPSSLYHTDDAGTDHRINGITLTAEQATTSTTAIDFTGIPVGVKRITVMLDGVSTDGSSVLGVQLGDTDGFETSGYVAVGESVSTSAAFTTLFPFAQNSSAAATYNGAMVLTLQNSSTNTWTWHGNVGRSDAVVTVQGCGIKPLSAVLDSVRLTTVSADDFDAGACSISYE